MTLIEKFNQHIFIKQKMIQKLYFRQFLIMVFITSLAFCTTVMAQSLDNLYKIKGSQSASFVKYQNFSIPINREVEIANLTGPGMITQFYFTDRPRDSKDPRGVNFASGLVLKIFWDEANDPSVNVPLSDFFGAFKGIPINYETYGISVQHFYYACQLPMPFSKRARFVLSNDGDEDYVGLIAYGIDYENDKKMASEQSRFHCGWQRTNPTNGRHTFLDIKGKGQYIGNFLQVFSNFNGWWGEGDTQFTIDGKFYTHTPGTEDEYGSCWAFGDNFIWKNVGYVKMSEGAYRLYRWYPNNPVRFSGSLKVEIQNQRDADKVYNPVTQPGSNDDYISVAFWYQEGAKAVSLQPYMERVAPSKAAKY